MVHIRIKKGLDIPVKGKPQGAIRPLVLSGEAGRQVRPKKIALNLAEFTDYRLKLLVKVGDVVKLGQPLVEERKMGIAFVAPSSGRVSEIRRGLKRVITDIVIESEETDSAVEWPKQDPKTLSREKIIERLLVSGGFSHIRKRPFNLLPDPKAPPRAIFVKAVESLPFVPPAEMQVEGHEALFQAGLEALKKMTDGAVHLIYRAGTTFKPFIEAKNVVHHTVEGPHPAGNLSVHIENIDRIKGPHDNLWTLNAHDVVILGSLFYQGVYFVERVIGIGGPAAVANRTGYFRIREGYPVADLVSGRVPHLEKVHLISGDPLGGKKVEIDDFLGFDDFALFILEENTERKFLHFFRFGTDKFTASRAYLSGHLAPENTFDFTSSLHGEERPFIDDSLYKKVQPLSIPTMPLVKAVQAQDFELAEDLGLAEVVPEDFALPTFVCPSKIEMCEIIKQGQKAYAKEILS